MKPSPANNYNYSKYLRSNANKLRKDMTKAEACLWKYVLRAGGVKGFTFRKQRPVLNYIADFMCKELALIIEVDGITHTYEEVSKKDKIRQKELENAGFTVIRFSDNDVIKNINWVNEEIEEQVSRLMELKGVSPPERRRRSNEE